MTKTKKAGDAKSPAKPIKNKSKKKSTATIRGLDVARANMISVADRLMRQIVQEREQRNSRPISRLEAFDRVAPRCFEIRRALLCGDRVSLEEYQEMIARTPPMFWEDIEAKPMVNLPNNMFALTTAWYKAKLSVNPDKSFDITVDSLNSPYRSRVLVSRDEYEYAKGRMPTQAFFDMKFCQAVEDIKDMMRKNSFEADESEQAFRLYTPSGSTRATSNFAALTPEIMKEAIERLSAKTTPKKPKSAPSPFSLIDLD